MKKFAVLLILIVLFVTTTALTEEITLPGGLKFGMSMADASMVSGYPREHMGIGNAAFYKEYGLPFGEYCLRQNVVIGGKNAELFAFFDESGLRQIVYSFNADDASSSHKDVEESLQQKYGDSCDPYTNCHMYMPPIDQIIYYNYTVSVFGNPSRQTATITAVNPTLRIVQESDGSVVYIDNYLKTNDSHKWFTHCLSYTYYPHMPEKNTDSGALGF